MRCSFKGCRDERRGKSDLCAGHARQRQRGQSLRPLMVRQARTQDTCSFPDCGRPYKAKGLCVRHRRQQLLGQKLRPLTRARFGLENPRSTLDPYRAKFIKEALASGEYSRAELAEMCSCSLGAIGDVARGNTWKNIGTNVNLKGCSEALWKSSASATTDALASAASPQRLLQEHPLVRVSPWRVLLACALTNRTGGHRALPALLAILERWPFPWQLMSAPIDELSTILRPLGFQHVRAIRIKALCRGVVKRRIGTSGTLPAKVIDLPGVGQYAQDAWDLFVVGRTDTQPVDKELDKWAEWQRCRLTG